MSDDRNDYRSLYEEEAPSPCGQEGHRAVDWVDERKGERRRGTEFHSGESWSHQTDVSVSCDGVAVSRAWHKPDHRQSDRRTDDRGGRCRACEREARIRKEVRAAWEAALKSAEEHGYWALATALREDGPRAGVDYTQLANRTPDERVTDPCTTQLKREAGARIDAEKLNALVERAKGPCECDMYMEIGHCDSCQAAREAVGLLAEENASLKAEIGRLTAEKG